jgi:hypothetical protein
MKKLALVLCSLASFAIGSNAWAHCSYHDEAKVTMTPATDDQNTQTTDSKKLIVDTKQPATTEQPN